MCSSNLKQFNEFIKCTKYVVSWLRNSSSQAARPPRGGFASEAPSPAAPSASKAGDGSGMGRTSSSPLRGAGGGGSLATLRANLSASGAVASQFHWLLCNVTPPRSTGTSSTATPGNNQDVWSRSSWRSRGMICERIGNQQNIRRSKFMRDQQKTIRVLDYPVQQCVLITFSTTVLAATSVVLRGVLKICNTL